MFIENIQSIILHKWILISSFFSALTIIVIRYYLKYKNIYLLLVAMISEIGLIYSYINMLKKGDILTDFALVKIISVLIIIFPSMMFLDVELTNRKILGLLFAFMSIYLLS